MNSGRLFFTLRALGGLLGLLCALFATHAFSHSPQVVSASTDMAMNWAPLAIGGGALIFAAATVIWLLGMGKNNSKTQKTGQNQVAHLRAELDEYEAVLSCLPEVTLLWRHQRNPQMFGKPEIFGVQNLGLAELLNFEGWLTSTDAIKLSTGVKHLHSKGEDFSISLHTKSGQKIRAVGSSVGDAAVIRLRNATAEMPADHEQNTPALMVNSVSGVSQDVVTVLTKIPEPAWLRNNNGQLVFGNDAYLALCAELNIKSASGQIPEIFSAEQLQEISAGTPGNNKDNFIEVFMPGRAGITGFSTSHIKGGSFGYLLSAAQNPVVSNGPATPPISYLNHVIGAVNDPMVMFDKKGRLSEYNAAYVSLFSFEEKWLSAGLNEREIIDYLRRHELLPAVPDYRSWRAEHLKSYSLKTPRRDIWHLSDGRTLEVTATPNTTTGGVIYTFCDLTEQLRLQSSNNTMLNVQRETLNSLNEGVAVFGTDGRLRLNNPQLSTIWKLPMNELGQNPHIDQIALACGKSMPEDGEEIWQKLKSNVVDLNPDRKDKSGRLQRKDGRLIDYAIVRLADSQTMLTFMDVTQSANYENVLKERNDALVTADRLKDAFVQNVSYELRSPLTSIIGFADLLALDSSGPLTEQQRAYTDYIRSSSATLGVLVDSILDLTNVDAGIAELDLQEQDISSLIEKAKVGISATQIGAEGAPPLNLQVSLPDPMPKFVADGARVVQILYNLLSNAAKFSEPGALIKLDVSNNSDWVRFTIQDEGVGIPQEMHDALTKSDRDQSLKGQQRGVGIGLLIVKAFVALHHGTINMEPNGRGGSKINVNLPANGAELADQARAG